MDNHWDDELAPHNVDISALDGTALEGGVGRHLVYLGKTCTLHLFT